VTYLNGLSPYELRQLHRDALSTRTALVTRGWTRSRLISFGTPSDVDSGQVCMTGAAGCGVEADKFVQWARWGPQDAKGYRWQAQTKRLLLLIAEIGTQVFDCQSYYGPIRTVRDAISTIISINDSRLKSYDRALEWIDRVVEVLEEAIGPMGEEPVPLMYTIFKKDEPAAEEEIEVTVEDASGLIARLLGDEEHQLEYQEG
jgi:hypothetical protein